MTAIDQTSDAFLLYRDAHKDAYGFRGNPTATTQEELEADFDRLCVRIGEVVEEEKTAASAAWVRFEENLSKVADTVGGSRKNALRFLMDAEGVWSGYDEMYDLGYFCYLNGLEYSKESTLKEMLG